MKEKKSRRKNLVDQSEKFCQNGQENGQANGQENGQKGIRKNSRKKHRYADISPIIKITEKHSPVLYGKTKDQTDYYMSATKKKLRKMKTDQLQKEKTNVF